MNRAARRAANARGARRERQTAQAVGSTRVLREFGESAPDIHPFRAQGLEILPEVKSRKEPLKVLLRWLAQCEGYANPGQAPVVVVFAAGDTLEHATVTMRWGTFARLSGLVPPPAQGVLPLAGSVIK